MHFQYFPIFIKINKITDCQLVLFEQKGECTLNSFIYLRFENTFWDLVNYFLVKMLLKNNCSEYSD